MSHFTPPPSDSLFAANHNTVKHAGMHRHSIEAWRSLNLSERKAEVCGVLDAAGRAMTDREVCAALGKQDMNYARPAITHLIDDGVLQEVGEVECGVTHRTVRLVWFRTKEHRP